MPGAKGIIERLAARGVRKSRLFDPVVEDWNDAAREREERAKADSDARLYETPRSPAFR